MGTAASVVVVHSAKPQEDADTLQAVFSGRFRTEKQPTPSSDALVLIEDNLTLLVVHSPTIASRGTYCTVILEEDVIRRAAEQAIIHGLQIEERTLSATTIIKMTLPGGSCLFASTCDVWTNDESRKTAIACLLAPPATRMGNNMRVRALSPSTDSVSGGSFHSKGAQSKQSLLLSPPSAVMPRSMSMPQIAPLRINGPPLSVGVRTSDGARLFPSLRVRALEYKGKYADFPLNTQEPVPVETELFKGHLLMTMRPADPGEDPYWNDKVFSKKKRRVVMQLQGKLKYKPKGILYAGMEISDPMRLGLFASGLCNLLLKMSQKFNPQIHYSFGDDKERPHICFPASTFFERLVVTPPGEEPPMMGEEFEEPKGVVQARKAYKKRIDWNTTDTYSMSFHSMYLDFPSWSVVRLPIGKDVSLSTFWGKSFASVVFYETESDSPTKKQLMTKNRYIVGVQLKHLGDNMDDSGQLGMEDKSTSDGDWSEEKFLESELGSISTFEEIGSVVPPLDDDSPGDDEGEDDEVLEFFDTFQSESNVPAFAGVNIATGQTAHRKIMRLIDDSCPCVIDMMGKKGKPATVFVFRGKEKIDRPIFRTLATSQKILGNRFISEADEAVFPSRLSSLEKTRRTMAMRYAESLNGQIQPAKLLQFQQFKSSFDEKFLNHTRTAFDKKFNGIATCFVARALSDRHWVEEWGCITDDEIRFYRAERSKPFLRVGLTGIVQIGVLPQEEVPKMPGFHFLYIETFGRQHCLMFGAIVDRDNWLDVLKSHKHTPEFQSNTPTSFANHLIDVDEPSSEFLQKSTMWDCNKRRILNCRKHSLTIPESLESKTTTALAEDALRKGTALQPKGPNDADFIEFLNAAAALKNADAHSLSETERLAFFLNLYHVMIMHAFLVMGPPDSSLKWLSYFNNMAYQCSDDIFSLAELEHNIIRAEMSYPSQFLSRFVLPKSQYRFALSKADFRINFALNCGSLSTPTSVVPIYNASDLESQLEAVTAEFLSMTVTITRKGPRDLSIALPRVCQWFAGDFGDGSTSGILSMIEPFLNDQKRNLLRTLWNEQKESYDLGIWNVKFLPYIFECRFLTMD